MRPVKLVSRAYGTGRPIVPFKKTIAQREHAAADFVRSAAACVQTNLQDTNYIFYGGYNLGGHVPNNGLNRCARRAWASPPCCRRSQTRSHHANYGRRQENRRRNCHHNTHYKTTERPGGNAAIEGDHADAKRNNGDNTAKKEHDNAPRPPNSMRRRAAINTYWATWRKLRPKPLLQNTMPCPTHT